MDLLEQTVELGVFHVTTPAAGLLKMLNNQLHTDVTFLIEGDQQVRAHRIILASQSEYFDCLLYGPMKEGRASEITLKETPAEAFRELLKFMYSGSVSQSMNLMTALDLHILADRFGFSFLKNGIESCLKAIISAENVLHFYTHAQVSSAEQLQEQCETFIDQNAKAVIRSPAMSHLPKESFKALVARDTFVVEEVQVFNAVQKWIGHNDVDKRDAVDLLECVRLTEIPHAELKVSVLPSGLYDQRRVREAMGVRETMDTRIATRGKTGENLNLFKETETKLLTCTNYLLDLPPDKTGDDWSCVADLLFILALSAAQDPAYITVRFDDVYIVNQISFDGYSDVTCSTDDTIRESPFCYQVWVSRDGNNWTTILDYSRLKCYSVQRLFFPKMAIRYVRILQTRGKEKFTIRLESCSYVGPVPYNFRELGVIAPFIPMRPDFRQFVRFSSNCYEARAFLTFNQPYSITTLRFRLHGLQGRGTVRVSVATQNRSKCYKLVSNMEAFDLSTTFEAEFEERPVSIINIVLFSVMLPHKVDPRAPQLDSCIPQFSVHDLVCQSAG